MLVTMTSELRILSFNIWRSGGRSLDATIDAIRLAAPDIAGLQECDRRAGETIATALGAHWLADDNGHVILSRHPIVDAIGTTVDPWGGLGATIALDDERRVHFFDAHLHWIEYGPYYLHEGKSASFVLKRERAVRMGGLEELLTLMTPALASGEPTFLVGDFNAPSHHDYPESLAWPTSRLCVERGLEDSYRAVHPVRRLWSAERAFGYQEPGLTWSPLSTEEVRGVFDRIDFIHHAPGNGTKATRSSALDSSNCVEPWPSDHRAVLSTFTVEWSLR
jgi:endonuclease/exonuclease/phosphatase family metal-dependent hydrolase